MINLAGLGMSFEQATAILADLSNPQRAEVMAYVALGSTDLRDLRTTLNGIYRDRENFDALNAQFPGLALNPDTGSEDLPLPVLAEVISLLGGDNE